ncbi:flagellar assembly protein FliH [Shewanella sp. Choline-02u-19]|uniref:flagellar assembly protein FliH n=1 Tax=unclassified Shewanella TaxID=196818 RepID=UPI000C31BC64|nr:MULTISPECIES: flagellar assembly protein FliH [unclassified Shewanella]PKG56556.1 flagellar assembly protein FliH [Shewanella sp. GutDb-MelDb]PKH55713.1 flagellar assembly protein FliH [Shewanella sp. Bg11-22]PKI26872.1 flagellar assembly protein FliH [Shewanella sp. Choline-02u-19]
MADPKEPKGVTVNTTDEFGHWDLPDITEEIDSSSLNMFGRHGLHVDVDNETEIEAILPPTLTEIEDIRAHAEQEGFVQGQENGHAEGLEKGRLEGLEQGHTEGFEQGQEQGYEAGLQASAEILQRFEALLTQFEQPLSILDTEIEKELLSTSMSLAKAVIGHELKTHPEHILSALRQGVDSLPIKEQKVNIRLSPDDESLVTDLYTAAQLERNRWDIEADPSLSAGDCIIHSLRSHIDMTVDTRIQHVFFELEKSQQDLLQRKEQQEEALLNQRLSSQTAAAAEVATATVQPSQDQPPVTEGEHANTPTPTAQ